MELSETLTGIRRQCGWVVAPPNVRRRTDYCVRTPNQLQDARLGIARPNLHVSIRPRSTPPRREHDEANNDYRSVFECSLHDGDAG